MTTNGTSIGAKRRHSVLHPLLALACVTAAAVVAVSPAGAATAMKNSAMRKAMPPLYCVTTTADSFGFGCSPGVTILTGAASDAIKTAR